uniref:N-acetyltransferase domain-containing protein n=1 Tax=Pinguiococcus pyrenoidosus TaxID=172671 RepID=A0A7R9UAE2_9STRA|mmetsp:Transcript_194/g.820  ORF Transcript_194/g.820 Transcript_194/m.820 type:complete len:232 (+) Transcript_194:2-697(+)
MSSHPVIAEACEEINRRLAGKQQGQLYRARVVTDAETEAVGHVCAQAFLEDPIFKHVLGEEQPEQRLRQLDFVFATFYWTWSDTSVVIETVEAPRRVVAGVVLNLPDGETRYLRQLAFVKILWHLGITNSFRMARFFGAVDALTGPAWAKVAPPRDRVLMDAVFVDPGCQGQGLGKTLIQGTLEAVNRRWTMIFYTESEKNEAFYHRCGCETLEQVTVEDVPLWIMSRPKQ